MAEGVWFAQDAYRRDGTRFGRPLERSRRAGDALTGDAMTTLLLPDLALPLARIFREQQPPLRRRSAGQVRLKPDTTHTRQVLSCKRQALS